MGGRNPAKVYISRKLEPVVEVGAEAGTSVWAVSIPNGVLTAMPNMVFSF